MTYSKKPLVGIIMGSISDSRIMKGAAEIFDEFKIKLEEYAKNNPYPNIDD